MNRLTLQDKLVRMPMLCALVPLAVGIVLQSRFEMPVWLLWGGFALCGGVAIAARSSIYTLVALLFLGWGVAELRTLPPDPLPRDVTTDLIVQIDGDGTGRISAWRDPAEEVWRTTHLKVVVYADSTLALAAGERICFRGRLKDLPRNSYGMLMRHREYRASVYIAARRIEERRPATDVSLHQRAVVRLDALELEADRKALCAAMTVGDKRGLTPDMKRAFARSGTSHLLAVSGLHVGIVFLLVNALLWWMPLLGRGHLLRNVAAIALIWTYAVVTGLSPSVVRAALMFSVLQLSLASASSYVSGNALSAAAVIMLLYRPAYLFDISFQLSFVAVAGILVWAVPLCRWVHGQYWVINMIADMVVIGVVAATATAPLVAHVFGSVSLVGVVVNPVVIPLAGVIVLGTLVWVLLPFPFLEPLLRPLAGGAAGMLNAVTGMAAALPTAAVEWSPTAEVTAAIYAGMVLITLAAWSRKPKKKVSLFR